MAMRQHLLAVVAVLSTVQSVEAYETSGSGVKVEDIPGLRTIRYVGPTYSEETPDVRMTWRPEGEQYRQPKIWDFRIHLELTYPVAGPDEKPRVIRGVETHPHSPATHTTTRPKLTCNQTCTYFEETNLSVLPYFLMESAGKPIKLTIHTMAGWDKDLDIPAAIVDEFIEKMGLSNSP